MTSSDPYLALIAIANTISTPGIRDFTIKMLEAAPPSFKTAPASKNNHPPDERGPSGNLIHSVRVAKLVKLMADSFNYDRLTTDILTSAAEVHDLCRYGLDDKASDTTLEHPLHPRIIAELNSITCPYADLIFDIAEKHMGKWGPLQHVPDVAPEDTLHIADMISAHANEVWEQLGDAATSWVGGVPFSEQGMSQNIMTLMEELAEDNEYWKTALSFIRSISSRKWGSLTDKQQDWAENIVASLGVELDRRTAKEVFDE